MRGRLRIGCLAGRRPLVATFAGIVGLIAAMPATALAADGYPGENMFSVQMQELLRRATAILPLLVDTLESEYFGEVFQVAFYVANVVAVVAFLRILRRDNGASTGVFWWIGRFTLFLTLLLGTNAIIDGLTDIGNGFAFGTASGDSVLNRVRKAQEESFSESYRKFVAGHFIVKVSGGIMTDIPPPGDGGTLSEVLGVLRSDEKSLAELNGDFNLFDQEGTWSMRNLYSSLSFSRGAMEIGDVFLILLKAIVLIGIRLAAPIMMALGIDSGLANRATYKFAWGTIVLTLAWPAVTQVIRIIAYTSGNIALAVADTRPIYQWDQRTLSVITDPTAYPAFTILIAVTVMAVCAFCMFASPYLAYKLSTGEVFEAVSNVASGWMGAIIGTGAAVYSSAAAAAIQKQAEIQQTHASADAGRVEAAGARDAGFARNQGQYVVGSGQARAGATTAAGIAVANAQAGAAMARNTAGASADVMGLMASKETQQRDVNTNIGITHRQVDGADQWRRTTNDVRQSEAEIQAGVMGSVPIGARVGPVGLNPTETATSSWTGLQRQETAMNNAFSGDKARWEHSQVDQGSRDQQNTITADVATKGAEIYHDLGERNAAAQLAAGEASAGAAWQGYTIQVGALAEGRILNDRATQTEFDSKVKSLDIIEHAGVEAARLRAEAAIVRTIGDQFASRVEEAAEQQRL